MKEWLLCHSKLQPHFCDQLTVAKPWTTYYCDHPEQLTIVITLVNCGRAKHFDATSR